MKVGKNARLARAGARLTKADLGVERVPTTTILVENDWNFVVEMHRWSFLVLLNPLIRSDFVARGIFLRDCLMIHIRYPSAVQKVETVLNKLLSILLARKRSGKLGKLCLMMDRASPF